MTPEQIAGLGGALGQFLRSFQGCFFECRLLDHFDVYCRGLLSDLHRKSVEPSHHELRRPVARYEQLRDYERLSKHIIDLRAQHYTSEQIAGQLNREGWHPPKRRVTFNAGMVRSIFYRRHLATPRPAAYALEPGEWWFGALAHELRLPHPTLYSWMRRGWVNAKRLEIGQRRWVLWADQEELERLRRLRACPKSWHAQAQAALLTRPKPWPGDLSKV